MSRNVFLFFLFAVSCLAQTEVVKPAASATTLAVHLWGDSTPIYKASSTLLVTDKFFRQDFLKTEQNVNPTKADFAYFVAVARSEALALAVEQRLDEKLRKQLMQSVPTEGIHGPNTPTEVLKRFVHVKSDYEALRIRFVFSHPDPMIAAEMANLFAGETINYQLKMTIDTLMKRVEDLRVRAESEREKLEKLSKKEMSDLVKIEYKQAKKLYSELIYELNYSKIQINLSTPAAYLLDHAYPPYRPSHRAPR